MYRLAYRLGGRISVSDAVVDNGLSASEAEGLLQGMSDGLRVRMEVDDRGLITNEFPEIAARRTASSSG